MQMQQAGPSKLTGGEEGASSLTRPSITQAHAVPGLLPKSQPVLHPTQQQQRQASQCQPRTLHGTGHSTFLPGGAPEIVY